MGLFYFMSGRTDPGAKNDSHNLHDSHVHTQSQYNCSCTDRVHHVCHGSCVNPYHRTFTHDSESQKGRAIIFFNGSSKCYFDLVLVKFTPSPTFVLVPCYTHTGACKRTTMTAALWISTAHSDFLACTALLCIILNCACSLSRSLLLPG